MSRDTRGKRPVSSSGWRRDEPGSCEHHLHLDRSVTLASRATDSTLCNAILLWRLPSLCLSALIPYLYLCQYLVCRLPEFPVGVLQIESGLDKTVIFPPEQHKHNRQGHNPPDRFNNQRDSEGNSAAKRSQGKG